MFSYVFLKFTEKHKRMRHIQSYKLITATVIKFLQFFHPKYGLEQNNERTQNIQRPTYFLLIVYRENQELNKLFL